MDRFIAMYERPFEFMVVPLFDSSCSDAYAENSSSMPRLVEDRAYMQVLVESFWKPVDTAFMGKIAAVMDVLLAQNYAERFQLILRWWKVYAHYHFPTLIDEFDDAVREVIMCHAKWCPLSALLESPQDTHQFASYVFHKIVLKGGLPRDTQIDMVLSFLGPESPFSPRIRVCTGQMTWSEYFLVEGDMDYSVKVYSLLATKYTKFHPTSLPMAAKALELLLRLARDIPGAIVQLFQNINVMVQHVIRLVEASSKPSEVWDCCCVVHRAIDECQGARVYPVVVELENRLYRAAMARKNANFRSKAARSFRDMVGKDRIVALKKELAVH